MQSPDSLADVSRVAQDAISAGAQDARDGDLGAAVLEWLAGIGETLAALVAVERGAWVALVALTALRFAAVVVYGGKNLKAAPNESGRRPNLTRRQALRQMGSDSLSLVFFLVAVTIGGNSVPILGWTILVFWAWAIWKTVESITRTVYAEGAEALDFLAETWAEVKRRNLAGIRNAKAPDLTNRNPRAGSAGLRTETIEPDEGPLADPGLAGPGLGDGDLGDAGLADPIGGAPGGAEPPGVGYPSGDPSPDPQTGFGPGGPAGR